MTYLCELTTKRWRFSQDRVWGSSELDQNKETFARKHRDPMKAILKYAQTGGSKLRRERRLCRSLHGPRLAELDPGSQRSCIARLGLGRVAPRRAAQVQVRSELESCALDGSGGLNLDAEPTSILSNDTRRCVFKRITALSNSMHVVQSSSVWPCNSCPSAAQQKRAQHKSTDSYS